ncbi:MAG: FKBP-type peptidyl-prolyl cis-trans isomerase [Rhodothermales bacterium]|nr:FKBP-type peptidyl-prolyl cis-trans isomerase [Rhodothermales bacterium]
MILFWGSILSISACGLFDFTEEVEQEMLPDAIPRVVADSLFTVTASGLKYYDFVVGEGDPVVAGETVVVDYNAWLSDSTLIDSSVLRGTPVVINLSIGETIPGWIEGMVGMRADGERQLIIPPALAYGETGSAVVPPNETLIFEITLY